MWRTWTTSTCFRRRSRRPQRDSTSSSPMPAAAPSPPSSNSRQTSSTRHSAATFAARSLFVQKAVPLLNDGASIVVTGSTSPPRATNAFGGYSASKAAIAQFVRVGAIELADRRIRVINRAAGRRCCARAPLNQIAGHGPGQYFGGTGRTPALGSFCAQTRLPDPNGVQANPPYPPAQHPSRGRG